MRRPARLGCLGFPHLALVVAWRAHPELASEAVLIRASTKFGREVVLAASSAARARGAHPGQDFRQAELACPEAVRLRADPLALDELRERLLLALYDFSPLVELADDGEAYLDLGGRDLRWDTEAARAAHLGRSVQRVLGSAPAVGVGQSRFVARAAAARAGPGRIRLVPPGGAASFLADQPVTGLPLPPRTVEQLLGFGLLTCGDCATIPLPDLQRQLGPDGITLHRLCLGQDTATLTPRREIPPCAVRKVLAGVVENSEALRFGAPELATMLAAELARRNLASGRLRLRLLDEDAAGGAAGPEQPGVFCDEVATPARMATAQELLPPILSLLSRARCRALIVELQALDLGPPQAAQAPLWALAEGRREEIGRAVARLQERFGPELVWRAELRPEHPGDIPEERLVWSSG